MKEVTIDKTKVALVLNYLIFVFVLIASIIMFTGIKITFIKEPALETTGLGVFKFFTVDSNILMGIVALLFARQERKLLTGKIKEIPIVYYIFKLMATVSVSLTFIVVFGYLGKIAEGGLISLLQNSNIFFHLVVPILSIIAFLCFERNNKIKASYAICGVIPMLMYGIYYVINIIVHMDSGIIPPKYDWYMFARDGISGIYTTAPVIMGLTLVVSYVIWALNRKGK